MAVFALTIAFSCSTAFADYYSSGTVLHKGATGNEVVNLQKDLK